MQFGAVLGEACGTFALTNIDDIFVLVTFFAEATTSPTLTPLKITIGQYVGFTILLMISMIGYAVALVLPAEPIGFLGLLPIMLGFWNLCDLFIPKPPEAEETEADQQRQRQFAPSASTIKAISKVALMTLMNGGDNISLYIPLFSQLKGPEIAVYVITYYILLGLYCGLAWLIMKQKHILALAQKYTDYVIPFLYMGLGVYIIVKSHCYPWTIEQIDDSTAPDPGAGIMAGVTTFILLASIVSMAWMKWRKGQETGGETAMPATTTTANGENTVEGGGSGEGDRREEGQETAEAIELTRVDRAT